MAITRKHYIIKQSSAHMPNDCWGNYVRTAVLEVEPGTTSVPAIDIRGRLVREIVCCYGPSNVGKGIRSAAKKDHDRCLRVLRRCEREAEQEYREAVNKAVAEGLAERSGEEV